MTGIKGLALLLLAATLVLVLAAPAWAGDDPTDEAGGYAVGISSPARSRSRGLNPHITRVIHQERLSTRWWKVRTRVNVSTLRGRPLRNIAQVRDAYRAQGWRIISAVKDQGYWWLIMEKMEKR